MFSEGQSLYLREVLGVTPGDLLRVEVASATGMQSTASDTVAVAVLAGPLAPEERELLARILGSVRLPPFEIIESLEMQQAPSARHLLIFSGGEARRDQNIWHLPRLSEMLGAGAEVNAKKKLTWNLLQQMVKEL